MVGQHAPRQNNRHESNGDVDQKHIAPTQVEQVGLNDEAANDGPENSTKSEDRPEHRKRLSELLWWKCLSNEAKTLREQHGCGDAFKDAEQDQRVVGGCHRAQQ